MPEPIATRREIRRRVDLAGYQVPHPKISLATSAEALGIEIIVDDRARREIDPKEGLDPRTAAVRTGGRCGFAGWGVHGSSESVGILVELEKHVLPKSSNLAQAWIANLVVPLRTGAVRSRRTRHPRTIDARSLTATPTFTRRRPHEPREFRESRRTQRFCRQSSANRSRDSATSHSPR